MPLFFFVLHGIFVLVVDAIAVIQNSQVVFISVLYGSLGFVNDVVYVEDSDIRPFCIRIKNIDAGSILLHVQNLSHNPGVY